MGFARSFITLILIISPSAHSRTESHEAFERELSKRSLAYFLDQAHPRTGLIRDRARAFTSTPDTGKYRMASVAATGFGLAVIANAATRDWISRSSAIERVRRALRFVATMPNRDGWLYHFVDWETGERFGKCEVSTVDTAWFLVGALYAAEVLGDPEISELAQRIYERTDFRQMMTNGGTRPDKLTLSMGWTPEEGYLRPEWDSYAEHLALVLLGLGHPSRPLPPGAWWAARGPSGATSGSAVGEGMSLFVHQYSHLFVDFLELEDAETPKKTFFFNSKRASEYNREFSLKNASFATYRAGFWGLSASDSRDGYDAFSPEHQNGTVCPGCAGASAMFLGDSLIREMQGWAEGPYGPLIWGPYGFVDGLNLDQEWIAEDVLGITVGALYLSLANLDDRFSVWKEFNQLGFMKRALRAIRPSAEPQTPSDNCSDSLTRSLEL